MLGLNGIYKVLLSLLLLLPAVACNTGSELQVAVHRIMVQEFTGDMTQSTAMVSGTAVNNGRGTIKEARVSVSFFDKKGNVIDVLSEMKSELAPGEHWNFIVELKGGDAWKVVRYSIVSSNK